MGESYQTDEYSTATNASRIPLPESAAQELAFQLAVVQDD